ncbi:MAG: kinase [Magnetococcales bacterium]|nr:kinase [Magnetococcales bacterium]
MIISKTPFRVSFFGGGTDYPTWVEDHGGSVLAGAINKYCYISLRQLPPFFEHRHRVVYSRVETVKKISKIQHPAIRAVLQDMRVDTGVEIHHDADLPARSGLGSSSSFTVGMVQCINAMRGKISDKRTLAREAIRLEQDVMKEHVGYQDQVTTAYGGFNRVDFHRNGHFDVTPVILPRERMVDLQDHLLLFFSGISRFASGVAKKKIKNLKKRENQLLTMQAMVGEAIEILQDRKQSITQFGKLLDESWKLKRTLSSAVTNTVIDDIYADAISAGASGGKLMGAGAGGFMVFVAPPEYHQRIRDKLSPLVPVDIRFDFSGSRIIVYDPEKAIPDPRPAIDDDED